MLNGQTHSLTRPTRAEAVASIAALIVHAHARGELQEGDGRRGRRRQLSVSELVEEWLDGRRNALAPKTLDDYERAIAKHIGPNIGEVQIARLHQSDLNRFYDDLDTGAHRKRRVHNILSAAFNYAVRMDYVSSSVVAKADPPRPITREMKAPEVEQVRKILELAAERRVGLDLFVRLAAVTGARRGELLALRAASLEGDNLIIGASISVARGDHGVGHNLIEKDTKTGVVRRLALDPETLAHIGSHRARLAERAEVAGVSLIEDHRLFTDDLTGEIPWRPELVSRDFRHCRVQAGVDGVRLHDLRHFAATMMVSSGIDIVTGANRLGNSRRDTFLNRYSHAIPATDHDAARVLGDLLDP